MTKVQKVSLAILGVLGVVVATTDLSFLLDDHEGNTYSSVIQSQEWLSGLVGYVGVHVSRRPHEKSITSSWWFVAGGAIMAAFASETLGGGIGGLVIGAGLGWAFWGNSGRT